uniref:Uncharacterized protein n=1 Tax=Leptospirillum ferrodiazotrophum TaxID=412449 RepID=C6HYS9_9BACT|nr:MAG: hypothetical protein UBAL3_94240160 [Leptospirillum ferrodiazotrophum]
MTSNTLGICRSISNKTDLFSESSFPSIPKIFHVQKVPEDEWCLDECSQESCHLLANACLEIRKEATRIILIEARVYQTVRGQSIQHIGPAPID